MSTRGFYIFHDESPEPWDAKPGDLNVYRHCDNYPTGAAYAIKHALNIAWELPRFEADEFAAAFVSANKDSPGGVRLVKSGAWQEVGSDDLEYIYLITVKNGKIHVTCLEPGKKLFSGYLNQFQEWAKEYEEQD